MRSDLLVLRGLFLAALALSVLACGPREPKTAPAEEKTTAASSPQKEAPPAPEARVEVPLELRNEAYRLYGLARTEPLRYELERTGMAAVQGEESIRVIEVKDGVARLEVQRTGGLADLGTDTYTLDRTGLKVVGTSMGEVIRPSLVMPADAKVGSSWTSSLEIDAAGTRVQMELEYRIPRSEKVTTKAGEYEALLVVATGRAKAGETENRVNARAWFVRDKGLVKQTIESRAPDGKVETMRVELVPTVVAR